ncbi:MAG: TIGR04282 family arsenosugar biosynthesis glycosyltransferase [Planctomycetota bacterium]|nr:TIGR04282 family arsenosugar biosynthesis glycosyltransferase [Planctomycetota bacterium]MDA1251191.1 TIGR04282 family arsenosugar biosynthesis glycosyltransferase [Planctomycetota bacterium]
MRTLGMFAKQPVPGRVKTRLAADWGDGRAAELYEAFVRDLLVRLDFRYRNEPDGEIHRVLGFAPDDEAARSWFTDAAAGRWDLWPQPNEDLGGRIAKFFAEHASKAGSSAVLIGSDSPTLPVTFILDAFYRLKSADVVICPASDGGYCLIGLRSGFVSASLFKGVDWSSAQVLGQTVERVRGLGLTLELLPIWYDVDSGDGVEMLRGHLAAIEVARHEEELTGLKHTAEFLRETEPTSPSGLSMPG